MSEEGAMGGQTKEGDGPRVAIVLGGDESLQARVANLIEHGRLPRMNFETRDNARGLVAIAWVVDIPWDRPAATTSEDLLGVLRGYAEIAEAESAGMVSADDFDGLVTAAQAFLGELP